MLAPGTLFDRYRIEQEIGSGGMGRVYRAFDTRLERTVALKVLHLPPGAAAATGDESNARLLREARAAAALVHPNVVVVFDVGEVGGVPFLVMELVPGASLRSVLQTGAPQPLRIRWLVEIARALAAAHRVGLVHRDIKPENVMVRDDGTIKVLDFGIARRPAGESAGTATLTAPTVIMGTLLYMAPEQARREPLDGRSDQFSWGVLGYELLGGAPPWDEGDPVFILSQILMAEPRPLGARAPGIPGVVAAVITRALRKDPGQRFATLDEAADALEPFVAPAPTHATGPIASVREARALPVSVDEMARTEVGASGEAPTAPVVGTAPPLSRTAPVAVAPAPRAHSAPRWLGALGAAILGGALVLAGVRLLVRPPPPAPTPVSSASARGPAAITDRPPPPSRSPEAVAAYQAALRAVRAGASSRAGAQLERAVELDPDLGAAHLEAAVLALDNRIDAATRLHYRKAEEHKDALSERDRALLEAIEPGVRHQPADWKETAARLTRAIERFPEDAELWLVLAEAQVFATGSGSSVLAYERAVTLDPAFATALSGLGEDLLYLGRFDDARRRLDQCVDAAPDAISCMILRTRLSVHEGACEEIESLGRRILAVDSEDPVGAQVLATGMAGHRGLPALREVLRQKAALTPVARRARAALRDDALVAALSGDFVEAERKARELAAALEETKQQAPHGMAARLLAEILLEAGRDRDAGKVAEAFLARRDAWEPDPRGEDFALAEDATPAMLAVRRRAGGIDDAELERARGEWLRAWEVKGAPNLRGYLWLHGHAFPASVLETRPAAERALLARESFGPVPPFRPFTLTESAEGITLALAGRSSEALPRLEAAARTCRSLDFPIEHTRAHDWLGRAREEAHDSAGACAAYRVVLERWGHARPRSVTADHARARSAALACGRGG
jgi:serine/threonine-protein kinase